MNSPGMILRDTGWQTAVKVGSYERHTREVDFSRNTREATVEAFATGERNEWWGQSFRWDFNRNNFRLTLTRAVDSGD